MKKSFRTATLALATLALAGAATAAIEMKTEDAIRFRQSGYTFMAWNMGKIKAQVVDGAAPYDKAQVIAAANAIAAVANSGMGTLYLAGSDKGKGWKDTRVKPEFFKEQDEVRKIALNYIEQANKLQQVAMSGDQGAIKAQFGETGKACKACHDKYRIEE